MNQILESQQTPNISPLRASYGVSFVKIILEKIDRVITAPHRIWGVFRDFKVNSLHNTFNCIQISTQTPYSSPLKYGAYFVSSKLNLCLPLSLLCFMQQHSAILNRVKGNLAI